VPTTSDDAYFLRSGPDRYAPTAHVGGAWRSDEMHFSPIAGLITHAVQTHQRHRDLQLSRISFDILGPLLVGDCRIHVETVRPGRSIELVEGVLHLHGRTAVRARAWYLQRTDTTAVAGGSDARLPPPHTVARRPFVAGWRGGYVASLDYRPVTPPAPGRAMAWLASTVRLVKDEPVDGISASLTLVDTANGIGIREDPRVWLYPNVDLTVHLHRAPQGPWVGFDTSVTFGPTGQGTTSTVLHDEHGPVGHAQQALTVRPAPD
jgi:hypothetical protein